MHILRYPDRYLQDGRVDAVDEGGTGAQTSGALQKLLDPGCDRCSHGDCIELGPVCLAMLLQDPTRTPSALCPDATGFMRKGVFILARQNILGLLSITS